jgi:cytochrome c oxidase cbb3-type subunit 3
MLLLTASCDEHRAIDPAAQSAQPEMLNPVGPVPGPRKAAALPANPLARDTVSIAQGRQLFVRYNCSGCHGDHGGGGMGPSLRDRAWRYGGAAPDIFASIAQGRTGMPSWGTKLPDEQIWMLTAYIESLRTPSEPEPPTS